jgi:hypothetical protein
MQPSSESQRQRKPTTVAPVADRNAKEVRRYFEYSNSGVEVLEDGLKEITFGEFLVEQKVLDRYQLFRALQMQDRLPGVKLGECAAALGYAPIQAIEKWYAQFQKLHTVVV